jgi:bifunctional non-homologous end joining protein LigD
MAMSIKGLPAGFIFPAQPVLGLKPPVGTDWIHEIKYNGYRMIVHGDWPTVRLYANCIKIA